MSGKLCFSLHHAKIGVVGKSDICGDGGAGGEVAVGLRADVAIREAL